MRRREFITLLGGAAAWPLAARAQQPGRLVRIGFLSGGAGPNPNVYGFQHGLRQLGYIEGQNLVLIYRWAAAQRVRVVDLARELLELNVDVFASHTTEAIAAIRSLNTAVPVVMTAISDPIGNGLVTSFARPGGNTTGVTLFSNELRASGWICSINSSHSSSASPYSPNETVPRPQLSSAKPKRRRKHCASPFRRSRSVPKRSPKPCAQSTRNGPTQSLCSKTCEVLEHSALPRKFQARARSGLSAIGACTLVLIGR